MFRTSFDAADMYGLQLSSSHIPVHLQMVSIPQAVCTRCNGQWARTQRKLTEERFQYRKRYVRVATHCQHAVKTRRYVSIPQAVCTRCNVQMNIWNGEYHFRRFQYRKRYVRVATKTVSALCKIDTLFQYRKRYVRVATRNMKSMAKEIAKMFQYRKRYVRVATRIS